MGIDNEGHELMRLFANWRRLPDRAKAAILVLAEVREAPGAGPQRKIKRRRSGESPVWLITALTILKDTEGRITDRAMAKRLDVSTSSISRCEAYQHAKKTYFKPSRKLVGNWINKKLRNI